MKNIEAEHTNIVQLFDSIVGVHDFVRVLNSAYSTFFSKDERTPFKIENINYYAFHSQKRYTSFQVPKKNGETRQINAPVGFLKLIQSCLNHVLHLKFKPHHSAHGFLLGRNVVTNARIHTSKQQILNVDLQDFFGSIGFRRVKAVLELPPFNLNSEKEEVAFLIANLCCHEGVLPQGAPTSPLLTNIVCQRLDRKLFQLAKDSKARYSRYADDITFSSQHTIFTDDFMTELNSRIKNEGFQLNDAKTRVQNWKQRQEVTGLVVNKKVNVNRNYIRRIRAIIHNYQKGGLEYAQQQFETHWSKPSAPPDFRISLKGQIEYLGMVRGKNDSIFLKYKQQFIRLFSDNYIDYTFVTHPMVKMQLESDFQRMEEAQHCLATSEGDRFSDYCVTAAFQLEQLSNYYLGTKMDIDTLKAELLSHTKAKPRYLAGIKHVGQVNAVYKYYLIEKRFYYGRGYYYESVITKLRNIRNHKLHRDRGGPRSESQILTEYNALIEKMNKYKIDSGGREYKIDEKERKLVNEAKAFQFLEEKKYKVVLDTLKDLVDKIRADLAN